MVEPFVEGARESLRRFDDWPGATHRFVQVRCRVDGGLVVLFERRWPLGMLGIAVAMSERPSRDPGAWAGALGVDPATDPEIAFFFSVAPEGPCT